MANFYPKSLTQKNDVKPLVVEKMVVVLVVVEGSDEQNDEVTDGTRPSWWRPLTECRPLYSTLPSTKLNTAQYSWVGAYQTQHCPVQHRRKLNRSHNQ